MKTHKPQYLVGVFLLLGLAAVAYLTIKLGSGDFVGRETYLIEARFANSGGLKQGSSVLISGVLVGRVESVRLDTQDYSAIASMRVFASVPLPEDTMASIKTSGLIGDRYIALAPGADETYLKPGDRILMTESAIDLESLISRFAFGSLEEADPAMEPTELD
jgi:phospholipid/cholesterol/gamma-HCH transport system substrate-binding protein